MKKYYKVYELYKSLFYEMYNIKPVINYGQCSKLLNERMKDYSEDIICQIIDMYFSEENPDKVFHLPAILSSYSFNKFLPRITKINKSIYEN